MPSQKWPASASSTLYVSPYGTGETWWVGYTGRPTRPPLDMLSCGGFLPIKACKPASIPSPFTNSDSAVPCTSCTHQLKWCSQLFLSASHLSSSLHDTSANRSSGCLSPDAARRATLLERPLRNAQIAISRGRAPELPNIGGMRVKDCS